MKMVYQYIAMFLKFFLFYQYTAVFSFTSSHLYQLHRQTDRYFIDKKKSHYRLICHRNERDICTCIYKIVSLLKSYDNIHGMTYTAKIMLSGIAKIKTGYFDNINDYY